MRVCDKSSSLRKNRNSPPVMSTNKRGQGRFIKINRSKRPPLADIDGYAEGIVRRVEKVLVATGAARVILVGHSMGGLASRADLRRQGSAPDQAGLAASWQRNCAPGTGTQPPADGPRRSRRGSPRRIAGKPPPLQGEGWGGDGAPPARERRSLTPVLPRQQKIRSFPSSRLDLLRFAREFASTLRPSNGLPCHRCVCTPMKNHLIAPSANRKGLSK